MLSNGETFAPFFSRLFWRDVCVCVCARGGGGGINDNLDFKNN